MASLIGWLKRGANIVNNDVLRPIQRDVIQPVQHFAQPIERPIGHFVNQNIARPVIGSIQGFPQTFKPIANSPLVQGIRTIGDIGSQFSGQLTHNQQAINNAILARQNALGRARLSLNQSSQYIKQNPAFVASESPMKNIGEGNIKLTPKEIIAKSPTLPSNSPAKHLTPDNVPIKTAGKGSVNLNKEAFTKEDIAKLNKLNAQDKANLPSREQMALANSKLTPLETPAINTARNPFKSSLTPVKAGDYGHAIANSQAVSRPIETARAGWEHAMKRLAPAEQANFWRAVEAPGGGHSPRLQEAINRWRAVDNKVHGESQALGGNTNYLTNHNLHPWQLPEEYTNHIIQGGSPSKFTGLNNISRKYLTIAEGEQAGLKLGTNPIAEGNRYLQANSAILRKQALKQGLSMADAGATRQPFTRDLGNGHTIQLSEQGYKATKGVSYYKPTSNVAIKGLRTANQGIKSTVLSLGQFHTINIGALRAAPTLVLKGHPIAAAKGLYGMFRGAFGTEYADHVIGKAIKDGTVDKAAQIGMPYGGSGYATEGSFLKHGVGQQTVFGKQIPIMHDQVARSIIRDLEKKSVALDSPAARTAGKAGANLMGELNHEAQNISPQVRRGMTDWMLAGQFTPSKFSQLKTGLTKGGVGGSYARANVAANVAATSLIITGVGYALKQKSDDIKDMLLRALIDPAIPTPLKDAKGNTIKLRLPGTDTSDIAKLVGIKLTRNPNGHLGIDWKPGNLPSTVADFARARLSPIASAAVKVGTNTTYANNPLYNSNAPLGTKAIQAGTSLGVGNLPIGLQGLPQTQAIKSRLPKSVQDTLNLSSPGTNPLVKSIGSSFGLTPSTDQTVGKALKTSQYFAGKDNFTSSLNKPEQDLFNKLNPQKKDSFGNTTFSRTPLTSPSNYADLLSNPSFLNKYVVYQRNQPSHDPLWDLNAKQLRAYMNAQVISKYDPGGDTTTTSALYKQIPKNFFAQRTAYFNQLKAQGVKLSAPTVAPRPSMPQNLVDFSTAYHKLPYGTGVRSAALRSPTGQAYIAYLDKNRLYNNQQRADLGLPPLEAPVNKYGSSSSKTSKGRGRKLGSRARPSLTSFKTSTKTKIAKPKGIKVKKVAGGNFKAPKTRKLSVSKIPSNYLSKRLA